MADKQNNVVLNFKMEGQVQYASTLKDINAVMNTAAKEYKNHIAAMGQDASATDKLTAEKKKLEIQMEAAQKRTELLRNEFEEMSQDTNTTTAQLTKMYGKLLDSENAENTLQASLDRVNNGLSDQAQASRDNLEAMDRLQDESSGLQLELDKLNSEYELQKSQLGENATEAEKNALAQDHLAKQSDVTEKQIANMEQQLEVTKREYGENSAEAQKMEIALNEAKASFNNLGHEMEGVSGESDVVQGSMGKLTNLLQSQALMQASQTFAEIGDKLKDLGENSVDAFKEIKGGQDTVVETTGATGKTLDGLLSSFHKLAKTMPDDAADVGTALGQLHVQFGLTGKDLEENTDLLLQYATVTSQDVTSATQQARQVIDTYGLKLGDLENVLDAVTKAHQDTGVATQDLLSEMIKGAPQIKDLGLSFADGAQLIGKFTQEGIDSGTALTSLSKATATYAKQHKTLQQGLAGTIDKIKNSKDVTTALNEAVTVFGVRAGPRMLDAIKRGALNFDDLSKSTKNASGAVRDTFSETFDDSDQFEIDMNNIKDSLSTIGGFIEHTLEPIIDKFSNYLSKISKGFNNLSPAVRDFIVILGVVTTGMLTLTPVLLAVTTTMIAFDASFLPVLAVTAGIIVVITGLILLFKNFSKVTAAVGDAWRDLKNSTEETLRAYRDNILDTWGKIKSAVVDRMHELESGVANIWQDIKDITSKVWTSIKDFFGKWGLDILAVLTGPTGVFVRMVIEIVKHWTQIKDTAGKIWGDIKSKILDVASDIKTGFTNQVDKLETSIVNKFDSIRTKVKNIISDIKNFFKNLILKIPTPKLPKLPHFDLKFDTKTIFGKTIKFPSGLDVEWRAKGAIFTRPTIFGASGGQLQGAGDAGAEAALPLNDETLGAIGAGIAKTMGSNGQPLVVQLVANSKVLAQTVVDDITALQVTKQKEADDFAGLPRRG